MAWDKVKITLDDGAERDAMAPVIVSASRSTDIPAFYADWFFHRLEKGYSAWTNPFNRTTYYVAYQNTRFIVFWSKNPKNLIEHLPKLKAHNPPIGTYVQYTLNDYDGDGLELAVPKVQDRIDTFKRLVDALSPEQVIWRFDPLILTDRITQDVLLERIDRIASELKGYTQKLVFSFADIMGYTKVRNNLKGIRYHDWTEDEMHAFAQKLSGLNQGWGFELATCAEAPIFRVYGIEPNRCIDDRLIARLAWQDKVLLDTLKATVHEVAAPKLGLFSPTGQPQIPEDAVWTDDSHTRYILFKKSKWGNKDTGQRKACQCAISKDIGSYNTCTHQCVYCYANDSIKTARENYAKHRQNHYAESITGGGSNPPQRPQEHAKENPANRPPANPSHHDDGGANDL